MNESREEKERAESRSREHLQPLPVAKQQVLNELAAMQDKITTL